MSTPKFIATMLFVTEFSKCYSSLLCLSPFPCYALLVQVLKKITSDYSHLYQAPAFSVPDSSPATG